VRVCVRMCSYNCLSRLTDKANARRYVNIYLKDGEVFRGKGECRRKIPPQGQPCTQRQTPREGMRRAHICSTRAPPCERPRIAILLVGMPGESISAWISRLLRVADWLNPFLSSGEALSGTLASLHAGSGNQPI
jgi:hypothetical protein